MASAKDDVFIRVEAVLSNEWIKSSGKELTAILEEVENLGVEGINFHRGNHVIVGSLEQMVRIREHFLGREKHASSKQTASPTAAYSDQQKSYSERCSEPQRNDLSREGLQSKPQIRKEPDTNWALQSKKVPLKTDDEEEEEEAENPSGNEDEDQTVCRELMVDNDIWDYIENKKLEELRGLKDMFAATVTKTEDDSGVLRLAITPNSRGTASKEIGLMHEMLVGLYQETFTNCVIEKHEVHFSDEEAELVLEYVSEKFPDVYAKRCVYNDEFLFIGRPRLAREARQQFQVLAQRLKKGQLKARMDERIRLDDYDRWRRRGDRYEERYEDPYEGATQRYPNDFNNLSNEDTVKRRESFTDDEVRVISLGEGTTGNPDKGIWNEEEERKEERQEPQVNLSTDFDLPAFGWKGYDKDKDLKSVDEVKQQSEATSVVYRRQDTEEVEVTKRSNSDVEDGDWKQDFSDENLASKNDDERVDNRENEFSDAAFETCSRTKGYPDFSQKENKTGSCDESGSKLTNDMTKTESSGATKSLDDVYDGKEGQTQDDGHVFEKRSPTARIDANSLTYQSLDHGIGQTRGVVASKNFEDSLSGSTDGKTFSSEAPEEKPQKPKKKNKSFDSGPKVTIRKPSVPKFSEPGDDLAPVQTEVVGSGAKAVVSETKVVSEKSVNSSVDGKTSTGGGAVKPAVPVVPGPPCRPVSELEERELRELFTMQKKRLQKMPFDSSSSEGDDAEQDERGMKAAAQKQSTIEDTRATDELLDELMSRGDEDSQKLLQSLLEEATSDAGGGESLPVDNDARKDDGEKCGGGKFRADVPAAVAGKPSASVGHAKAKDYPTVLQPPDGMIGCVMDKAFHLDGHNKSGTIEINILFEAGYQAGDQLEPGRPYKGITMKVFLPASGDGRETLRLMKAAFAARKLFTLERRNDDDLDVVVPNGVTFKDSADSYPDPGYLPKVMEQLRMLTENEDK